MSFIRLFTEKDGRSRLEDLDVTLHRPRKEDLLAGRQWKYLDIKGLQGAVVMANPTRLDTEMHCTPRRLVSIYITGSREYIDGHGHSRVVEPGDILLAEDLTGEGHMSRSISDPQQVLILYVDADAGPGEVFSELSALHPYDAGWADKSASVLNVSAG
jgi:hypothetical protein